MLIHSTHTDTRHPTPDTARLMPMPLRITQVDAFTNRPFAGNPAAVCILPKAADPAWMLNIAREMNLAEERRDTRHPTPDT